MKKKILSVLLAAFVAVGAVTVTAAKLTAGNDQVASINTINGPGTGDPPPIV